MVFVVLLNLIGVEFVLLLLLLLVLVDGYGCKWAIERAADVVFERKMLRLRDEPADVDAPLDDAADDDDELDGLTVLNCNWMSIM